MSVLLLSMIMTPKADASVAGKVLSLALKPVTIPLKFAGHKAMQGVRGTARAGVNTAKAGLSNISISAGPFVSVRPFDFRR